MTQNLQMENWGDVLAVALLQVSMDSGCEVVIPVPTLEIKEDLELRVKTLIVLGDENAERITVELASTH